MHFKATRTGCSVTPVVMLGWDQAYSGGKKWTMAWALWLTESKMKIKKKKITVCDPTWTQMKKISHKIVWNQFYVFYSLLESSIGLFSFFFFFNTSFCLLEFQLILGMYSSGNASNCK